MGGYARWRNKAREGNGAFSFFTDNRPGNFVFIYHFSFILDCWQRKILEKHRASSLRANQRKYYLFVSLHIHAPPQSIKESRNVGEMERRGWEQQQTAQAGRKITCRRIRDDVWEENKLFRGNFLLCARKGASGGFGRECLPRDSSENFCCRVTLLSLFAIF